MLYSAVARSYADLERISGRNEITNLLAQLLKSTPLEELPPLVYMTQGKLRPDYEGVELGLAEKLALRALASASGSEPARVYTAYVKHGDIGAAAEELLTNKGQGTLFSEALTLKRVYETLLRVARQSGSGSVDAKLRELASLLNDASPLEAKYIMRTVTGELRLGVADYTVLDAAATAFLGGKDARPRIERAYNVHPDLGFVVASVASRGLAGVDGVKVEVGVPIRPMLAERLSSAQAIMEKLEGKVVAAEYKLDGERLQIHRDGDDVKLFSRRLEVVTSHYPDAADLVREHVGARKAILEAEVVAIDEDTGEYLPFQELMHRRRKHGIQQAMADYPVALNFFDILLAGASDLTRKPYTFRRRKLKQVVKETSRTRPVPSMSTSDPRELERFMEDAITDGCEGLVVKDPDSPYRAGAREFAWIKLKREYRSELTDTLDLVVIGAFHGRGRRAGSFGTFLLGTFDSARDVFTSVAKVGTGFSDEDLAKFPRLLKPYESHVRPPGVESKMVPDVWFRPHLVIEVIAAELTLSPIHTAAMGRIRPEAGISLRFPKFTGKVRDDKRPEDSTTVDEIVGMYQRQVKRVD
ncbi:MAG: ATP-dependent DNA ligase [Nitrososphaerota archaeon]|nr:ATP-dependent DNA ligase [Nitrososphaerota archaeon]MDG7026090.1 ATP-dependent DNA ligase [Nitrososphaerota archaeon]